FHDVVGHQIAVLSVQLGVIEISAQANPAATQQALTLARTSLKSVLLETQRILNVLRSDSDPTVAGLTPTPGVASLGDLVASFRLIGLDTEATIGEAPRDLSPAVDVTLHRIVQEGLTNAHRYGAGHATVSVAFRNGRVTIDIGNELGAGPPTAAIGSGYGLIGMRERVASAGGVVKAGVDGEGVFRVHATLSANGTRIS
ncbi:MAG: histidine kinase, partial [Frondihabitans sp.]|nr:histidine kinase [Frondihabitans sp.]